MTLFIENGVPVAEIAAHLKRKPDDVAAELRSLDATIGEDWAGRSAVSPSDARLVASDDARREREREKAEMTARIATEDWVKRRVERVNAAYVEAVREQHRAGKGGGEAMQAAREVANEAGRRYELTVPRPAPERENLAFVSEEEAAQKGVASRIKEMIKR